MASQQCANIGLGTAQIASPSKLDISIEASGRVCLSLEYTDPGRILNLCRSLFEKNSILIQKKINKYLMTVIPCCSVFQIIRFSRVNVYKITIIGKKTLDQEIHINHASPLYRKLKKAGDQEEIFLGEMQPDLACEIKAAVAPGIVQRCIAYPIYHPASGRHLSYVVLINYEQIIDYKRIYHGLINESMRYCIGILVNAVSYDEERIGHERARSLIEKLKDILINIGDFTKMLHQIKKTLTNLTDAEKSSLYLMNDNGKLSADIAVFGESINQESKGSEGNDVHEYITNQVLKSGKLINCSDLSDERCREVYTVGVRNQICCPLKQESQVVGVLEVYNKKSWHCFTEADEESVQTLAIILSPLLIHSLDFMKMAKCSERGLLMNSYFLDDMPTDYEINEIEHCTMIHDFPKYNGFQFSHLDFQNFHVGCIFVKIFYEFGLLNKFSIDRLTFIRFVLTVLKCQSNHSYHNWTQSFGVFHFATNLINSLNLVSDDYISCLEAFSLLLAAMCVSLSHCGSTTSFQVTAGTALGSVFSSPGSLQAKYSANNLFRIVSLPGCNIWQNICGDDFATMTNLISSIMKVTDLSCEAAAYHKIASSLQDFRKEDPESHLALLQLILQCSYLSDFTKPFSHLRLVGELLFFEFFRQGDLSNAGQVFDLTQFEPSPETVPALQIEFIDKICLPPFRLLATIFPNILDCAKRLEENLLTWQKFKDHFMLSQSKEEEKEEE